MTATAFALLKLPGMPELAHQRTLPNFTPSGVDPNTIKVRFATPYALTPEIQDPSL